MSAMQIKLLEVIPYYREESERRAKGKDRTSTRDRHDLQKAETYRQLLWRENKLITESERKV